MQPREDNLEMITDTATFQKAIDVVVARFAEAHVHAVERTAWENELAQCVAEIEGKPRVKTQAA